MWPNSPFAVPTSSFKRPVPVPTSEPTTSPTTSVSLSCAWLPYVRGALQQLLLQTTWDTEDPALLALTQGRVWNLISLFSECGGSIPPIACGYTFSGGSGAGVWSGAPNWGDLTPGPFAVYSSTGWGSVMNYEPGGYDYWQACAIRRVYSNPFGVGNVSCSFNIVPGNNYSNKWALNNCSLNVYLAGALVASQPFGCASFLAGGDFIIGWDFGGVSGDELRIQILGGVSLSNDNAGKVTILSVGMSGNGTIIEC